MKKKMFKKCQILLLLLTALLAVDQAHGSKCRNGSTPGKCTLVPKCSTAMSSIRTHGYHDLERCGFDNFTEIVCCPLSDLKQTQIDEPQIRGTDPIRKSQRACDKYNKGLPISLNYHIVNGENAELGEFPHMAALAFFDEQDKVYKFSCGGTLISHWFVITAAHCIINIQEVVLKFVRLGIIDVPESVNASDPVLDYTVVNITVHKDYKWKEKFNDLALAKLGRKVEFTDNIRPACLYIKTDEPERLTITGWGLLELGRERSPILQKAALSPVSLKECNATYQAKVGRILTSSQLCASDNSSDACQGDSGGPIQTPSGTGTSILTVVGITSYGIGCGSRYPGVYTRISSYLDWIENIVWP